MKDIILAFSGGTDSYTAVKILQQQGFRVHALHLDLMGDSDLILKAQARAQELNIPISIVDMRNTFHQKIERRFIDEYLSGATPSPCTLCNTEIKWRALSDWADAHNIEHIATGHYFKITPHNGKLYISRAADPRKDQSFYLWGVEHSLYPRIVTPMAEVIKSDITASSPIKGESMGVCFLRKEGYREYIARHCPSLPQGDIINHIGEVVAQHNGIANYTIGQRRGEGIPPSLYVSRIDAATNSLHVAPREALLTKSIDITHCNVVDPEELLLSDDLSVMVRGVGLNPEGAAHATKTSDGYRLHLSNPAWGVAAGQVVALYRSSRLIGGGYQVVGDSI